MQGRQEIQPKMYYNVSLDNLVPEDNFYRKLSQSLNLSYLYKATAKYYGLEGQESIDPVSYARKFRTLVLTYHQNTVGWLFKQHKFRSETY
jgi:hypothetical protein